VAGAADLPIAEAPVFTAAGVNWDGFYAGIHGGFAVGSSTWSSPTGYFVSDRDEDALPDVQGKGPQDGLIGGLQVGYNRQFGAFVLGFEADASFGPLDGYTVCGAVVGLGGSGDPCHVTTGPLASAAGRFGYALGRTLVFVKGGVAFASDQYDVINPSSFPTTRRRQAPASLAGRLAPASNMRLAAIGRRKGNMTIMISGRGRSASQFQAIRASTAFRSAAISISPNSA